MKLKIVMAAAMAAGLAACASAPETRTPSELIVGMWNCTATTPDGTIAGPMIYEANGTTVFTLTMTNQAPGMSLVAKVEGTAEWRMPEPGVIVEKMTTLKVNSAVVNGNDVTAGLAESIEDAMLGKEAAPSKFEISQRRMTQVDPVGTQTTCTR